MRSDLIEKAIRKTKVDAPLLINAVSQRVRELNMGRPPLVVVNNPHASYADIALQEILEDKLEFRSKYSSVETEKG